ncbi:MAG: hypothetical protein NZ927_02155 [Candidatus Calescibacterium sp.]|nr:hypothetical protein [Candidatus Calescibacterium sp.]
MDKLEKKVNESQTFEERLKIFDEFRLAKSRILSSEDFAEVVLRDKKTKELKRRKIILKSGWRKIKLFFGISSEILDVRREKDGEKIIYICKARVYTQSGIASEAVGICSSDEPGKSSMNEYVLSSIAQTRAINKAIADLVGVDFEDDLIEYERDYENSSLDIQDETREDIRRKENNKIVLADKNQMISKIFDMIKEIEGKIPRHQIFLRIKKHLKLDDKAPLKISELDVKQLTEILELLNSIKENQFDNRKLESNKEEIIF